MVKASTVFYSIASVSNLKGEEISTRQIESAAAPAPLASGLIRSIALLEAVGCFPK